MSIAVNAKVDKIVNFAATHLKKQTLVRDIELSNIEKDKVVCRISSRPEFLYEYNQEIEVLSGSATIPSPALLINDSFFRTELVEAQEGSIEIECYYADEPDVVLGFASFPVRIQPYLHWAGAYPETMVGFLQPNDPLVLQVIKRAGEFAEEDGFSMCGYQCRSVLGVKKQAEYIFRALQDMDIHYVSAPPSFETNGQKIRIPHQVLHDESKQGTCLDLAILFATCLEAVSLNSVLFIIPGHAFAGVWGTDVSFSNLFARFSDLNSKDLEDIRNGIIPVECTYFTDGKAVDFSEAVSTGTKNLESGLFLVDVAASRKAGLKPVYTYTDKPICELNGTDEQLGENNMDFLYQKRNRLDVLREQAMDISIKNRLLNCKQDKMSIEIPLDTNLFLNGNISGEQYITMVNAKKASNKDIIRSLYSKSRQNVREYGNSKLFIALNELKWRNDKEKYHSAVVYLCPVELYRNARGEYQIKINHDDIFFNPALRVLLDQSFSIKCNMIKDNPKEKYAEQNENLKYLIANQKGWSINENVSHLALFTIPNEAIWNGLFDKNVISNDIVKGIIDGNMSWKNDVTFSGDEDTSSETGLYAFETDSSQAALIEAAFKNRSQLVVGPAGNGKTQTVANIMLEVVKRGQTALFVSEKLPALEVAHSKLNEIFSGHFSLRIFSSNDKANDVNRQIKNTLDYLESGNQRDVKDISNKRQNYNERREYVSNYYEMMRSKNECGFSLEELIDMYEKYDECGFVFDGIEDVCDKFSFEELEDKIELFAKSLDVCNRANGEYSEYIKYDNLGGREEATTVELVEDLLNKYRRANNQLEQAKELLSLDGEYEERPQFVRMSNIVSIISECPVLNMKSADVYALSDNFDKEFNSKLISNLGRYKTAKKTKVGMFENACLASIKSMLNTIMSPSEINSLVEDYASESPEVVESVIERINDLRVVRGKNGEWISLDGLKSKRVLVEYDKRFDQLLVGESAENRAKLQQAKERIIGGTDGTLRSQFRKFSNSLVEYGEAFQKVVDVIVKNRNEFHSNYPNVHIRVLFEEWLNGRDNDNTRSRANYEKIVASMEEEGFERFLRQVETLSAERTLLGRDVVSGFIKSWASYNIRRLEESLFATCNFNNFIFQNTVDKMAELETDLRENLKDVIFAKQFANMPNVAVGVENNEEFGNLQKYVRKNQTSIRTFFEKSPHMLMNICPIMIMDPVAVAEYIPSDFPKFDIVIIDEGSQMPTYNALIPISKGKRCIIFGDEKQLQPTNEFKKMIEDDEEGLLDRESILTAAYIASMPRQMLRFHYRSEDESLIAFSNHSFYNNSIITFPACKTNTFGVSYEFVENGFYDRDGNKANMPEVERVINMIGSIYDECGDNQTTGVITFNVNQRDAIRKALLSRIREDSDLAKKIDELVSVVNLESCQGKEWDNVIISPGFAKDKDGNFSLAFGGLNREYGVNRLNVMLTRARKKMIVVTSIEPHMLSGSTAEGIVKFKEFLLYAKGEEIFDKRVKNSDKREKGLIDRVAIALENEGYEVHTNIGSSHFKVDLGIVSKKDPNKYELGIVVDHYDDKTSSIHDREILYPKTLESKGWKIYRLRLFNWNSNPKDEISQIKRMIGQN